mmetsp:Transcript_12763/g.50966  ORF Transcript_12763/g.50966 Transcript_12763/m.50966 type:complete len:819 (+) Transcript_12763:60-2516(+)
MGGSPPLAKLRVSVLEASGLQGKDFFKKTSTYCTASVDGETKQTAIIKNSQNPHWNQQLTFELFSDPTKDVLVLEVLDKQAIFRDESLGYVELPLAQLLGRKPHAVDTWKTLVRRKKKHRPAGQLHFSVEILPEAGVALEVEAAAEDWVVLGDNFRFDDELNGKQTVSLAMSQEGERQEGGGEAPPLLPARDYCSSDDEEPPHLRKREPEEAARAGPSPYAHGEQLADGLYPAEGLPAETLHQNPALPPSPHCLPPAAAPHLRSDNVPLPAVVQAVPHLPDNVHQVPDNVHHIPDNVPPSPGARAEADETEEERLFREFMQNELRCLRCKQVQLEHELVVLEQCGHRYCAMCMAATTCAAIRTSRDTEALCPFDGCTNSVPQFVLKMLLSAEEFEEFINRGLELVIDSCDALFRCPNTSCNVVIERIHDAEHALRQSSATSVVGVDGRELSEEAKLHREEFRFRCRSCATEFCSDCGAVPYHLGFTCAAYQLYLQSRHCRFCQALLPAAKEGEAPLSACFDVCEDEECKEKMAGSCTRLLPCGHPCGGIAGEEHCLPCLHEDCATTDVTAEDYCNICWVESLGSAPALRLRCGHVFHHACVCKKLAERWPSPRITFGFWNCPLCKEKMQHAALEADLAPIERLHEEIIGKALQRLKFENLDKSEEIIKKSGKYYRNPTGYAMDRFAYYPCFICKKAYFGGQRRCDAGDRAEAFKPEDLVCGGCSGADASDNCPKHGKEFMEHKCQYCCAVATWYCWGKVHFCDACHTRQQKGDYISKYPREKLPVCPGKERCPLQLDHPPNGDPYCLGCVICRNTHDF